MIKKNMKFFIKDFFFKLRCKSFKYLFKRKKGYLSEISTILDNLYENGYYKVENYYSLNQINYFNKVLFELINKNKISDGTKVNIEKMPGEIKIKNIQDEYAYIKRISNEMFLVFLSFIFNGKLSYANVLIDHVHDGSSKKFYNNKIEGVSSTRISGNLHIDDYKPILKVAVLLDDVNESVGAHTCLIPNSARNKIVKKLLKENMTSNETEKIIKDFPPYECFGNKGDVFFMDTRNIHWGAKLKSGNRSIMWFYF